MSGIIENVWAMQNELRNKEGITGIDAMHHVLMVLLAKSFTNVQCQKLSIPEEYAFENMISLNKTDLFNKFYNPSNSRNCIVRYIREGDMFGYNKNFPFQIKNESTLEFLYSRVNKIDHNELMDKLDIIGDIYEHFINREGKTMKDLGQYFTDRLLIRYLVQSIKPGLNPNGDVPSLWDPASGTGGFLIEYIHQLNELDGNINWSINKNNIFANDINKNTYTLLKQNLYYAFKEASGISIKLLDSLCNDDDLKYDNILANPPFGIKGLKYKDMNQQIKNLGINGTKGEILFLQLCMAKLNDGGKCCIVVPEGVLFNSTKMYKETRKYLLENFNLKRIIKVGEGEFFKNTGVKTSVLCFEKTGSTQEIELIQVNKVNGDIQEVPLMSINIDKIIENDYSLNMNLYKEIVLDVNDDFEVVELGELFTINKGTISATNTTNTGEYTVLSVSNKRTHNEYTHEGETLAICGHGGGSTKLQYTKNNCILTTLMYELDTDISRNNKKYMYYYLKENINMIRNLSLKGACQPSLDFVIFNKIRIPVPPLEVQNRIVEQLDNIYENEINTSKEIINGLKKSIETIMKNTMYRDDLQEYEFNQLYKGKPKKNKIETTELYHKYQSGGIVGEYNYYEYDGKYILFGRKGCVGNPQKINGKFSINENVFVYDIKTDIVLYNYIYNHLKYIINYQKYIVGATMPGISYSNMSKYKIVIPPIDIQREILSKIEPKEKLIEDLEKNIACAENEAKDIMSVLFNNSNQDVADVSDEPEPEQ